MTQTTHTQREKKQRNQRAEETLAQEIDYIDNPEFRRRNAEERIINAKPERGHSKRSKIKRPANVPAYFATLYETPLLSPEEEAALFRKFNYLKYRADRLRKKIKPHRPDETLLDEIEFFLAKAHEAWDQLVQANLRLVVSIARRFADSNNCFDELVSDGQIALMNAIEKFDFSRGFRFSTYATHAIQRSFYRRIKNRQRDISRVKCASGEVMDAVPDRLDVEEETAEDFKKLQQLMKWIDEELDDRERQIVAARFGFNSDQESSTLRSIGRELGISKERVRQIQIRAIEKLQELAAPDSKHLEAVA